MLTAYRIFKTKHAATWYDGEGAFRYGGRWNLPGTRVLYASSALSLAMLEILVNLGSESLLGAYSYAEINFDESLVMPVEDFAKLPKNWNASPAPTSVQQIGTDWATSNASAVLAVPSSVLPHSKNTVKSELNYIFNADHVDFQDVHFGEPKKIDFDQRLN